MFFPQYTPDNNGLNQLGVSDYFGINIKDWSYTKGTPISSTGDTATQGTSETPSSSNSDSNGSNMNGTNTDTAEGNDSGSTSTDGGDSAAEGSVGSGHLSTIVKVVIGLVAIVVALVTVGIIFIVIRKRQHRNQLCFPSTSAEKGIDDSIGGKPELQGSVATGRGVPYDKAELPQSLQPHDGSGYVDAKELDSRVFVAELPGSLATEGSVLEEFPAASADVNALKAQERELTRRMEMDEALCRLRAEQVALHDRIRVAEMQKQEANGG